VEIAFFAFKSHMCKLQSSAGQSVADMLQDMSNIVSVCAQAPGQVALSNMFRHVCASTLSVEPITLSGMPSGAGGAGRCRAACRLEPQAEALGPTKPLAFHIKTYYNCSMHRRRSERHRVTAAAGAAASLNGSALKSPPGACL
jgi:hypothetical protein